MAKDLFCDMKRAIWILAALALMIPAFFGLSAATLAEEMPAAEDELLELTSAEKANLIRWTQQSLIDLGYLSDVADGKFGKKSAAALSAFQADQGLEVTGAMDEPTMVALVQAASKAVPVTDVQQRLIDLGYLQGKADGVWGSQSTAALKLFQRINGLEPTGISDEAVAAKLFAEDVVLLRNGLTEGDKGGAVSTLQERLDQFGFLEVEPDGEYGKKTTSAVKAFQQHLADQGLAEDYGVKADGIAGPVTQYFLFDPDYSTYIGDVKPGETGGEALRVERRLNHLGYMDLAEDETLDDYAVQALDMFRDMADLGDGKYADQAVIDALFSADAPRADHCVPHDIASGDTGWAVRDVEEALVRGGMMIKIPNGKYNSDVEDAIERLHTYLDKRDDDRAELFADKKALSVEAQQLLEGDLLGYVSDVGSKGGKSAEILRVQRRLHTLLYLKKNGVDGKFAGKSREAIRAFQTANGLEETGVADEATQLLLFSREAVAKPYPFRVEVSIDRQRVDIYQLGDDGQYTQVQSFTCSTGLHNSTPRGIFLNGFPVNRWHYFEKFACWAQYSFDIEGDIMFHSVIYSSNKESSLRTSSLRHIGSPASHGCIRLQVEDAKWLFENCPRGSLAILIY